MAQACTALFLGIIILSTPLLAQEDKEYFLEGVVLDQSNPRGSFAIINGEPLQVGMKLGDFELTEVQKRSAKLVNAENGGVKEIKLKAKTPAPESDMTVKSRTASRGNNLRLESTAGQLVEPIKKPKNFWSEAVAMLKSGKNPMNRLHELQAIRNLAILHNAAMMYYEKGKGFPVNAQVLIKEGLLPDSFESGVVGKYKFFVSVHGAGREFGSHADPNQPDSGLLYFFTGTDGVVRESVGNSAGPDSPEHHYPGKKASTAMNEPIVV